MKNENDVAGKDFPTPAYREAYKNAFGKAKSLPARILEKIKLFCCGKKEKDKKKNRKGGAPRVMRKHSQLKEF